MTFIIDGDYNPELVAQINEQNLPVSHIIVHVPDNPLGNGSVFLPQNQPSFKEFEEYSRHIQKNELIPIAGLDSTCQGNLEAHVEQYHAITSIFKDLIDMGYTNFLVSSPNNVGLINEQFSSMNIYLAYSQYVTSLNKAKIFFEIGASTITLHPDIIRDFYALENFLKLKLSLENTTHLDYLLPLNIGCNWGCIQWYQHHNLQSHRTMKSSLFPDQENISDIEDEYDYPMLYCWKKRLQNPENILKAGWIAPTNIKMYEDLGYENFLLFTHDFSTEKTIKIIRSYMNKTLDSNFSDFINFAHPYGNYWPKEKVKSALYPLKPQRVKDFCKEFPYHTYYPFEEEINEYCANFIHQSQNTQKSKSKSKNEELIELIDKKMKQIEKGAVGGK
jgi:hypothetical protein